MAGVLKNLPLPSSEDWKPILGYEGLYEISNQGRVRSLDRIVSQTSRWGYAMDRIYRGRIVKPRSPLKRYKYVHLSKDGIRTTNYIHRLVASHFLEKPTENDKNTVNHINGEKFDNGWSNLEWCSLQENLKHSRDTGLRPPMRSGIDSHACKGIIDAYNGDGVLVASMAGAKEQRSLGFNPAGISSVLAERQGLHKGLIFKRRNDDGE